MYLSFWIACLVRDSRWIRVINDHCALTRADDIGRCITHREIGGVSARWLLDSGDQRSLRTTRKIKINEKSFSSLI